MKDEIIEVRRDDIVIKMGDKYISKPIFTEYELEKEEYEKRKREKAMLEMLKD